MIIYSQSGPYLINSVTNIKKKKNALIISEGLFRLFH